MTESLSTENQKRLEEQQVIWLSSIRADGRPHLVPIWFVWHQGKIYLSTEPKSAKARNIRRNPHVALALEDGVHPLICEGTARLVEKPWDELLLAAFFKKYEWDLNTEKQYYQVVEVVPVKWLSW